MMQHHCPYFIQLPVLVYQALGLNGIATCKSNTETLGGEQEKVKQGTETHTIIKKDIYNNIIAPRAVTFWQHLPKVTCTRN